MELRIKWKAEPYRQTDHIRINHHNETQVERVSLCLKLSLFWSEEKYIERASIIPLVITADPKKLIKSSATVI